MGLVRHHAIVVTSWNLKALRDAWRRARILFPNTTTITRPGHNGYRSFMIPPDGSNESRDHSNEMDRKRVAFVESLKRESELDWVEVYFASELSGPSAGVVRESGRDYSIE